MERQERVSRDIRRHRGGSGRMDLDQLLVVLEHRLDRAIDEIARQVLVRHGKIVEADGLVGANEGRIGSRRNARGREFRCGKVQRGDLVGGQGNVADLVLGLEFEERRKWNAGAHREHVERTVMHLRGEIRPVAENEACRSFSVAKNSGT